MGGDINEISNRVKIKMAGILYPRNLAAHSKIQLLNQSPPHKLVSSVSSHRDSTYCFLLFWVKATHFPFWGSVFLTKKSNTFPL